MVVERCDAVIEWRAVKATMVTLRCGVYYKEARSGVRGSRGRSEPIERAVRVK